MKQFQKVLAVLLCVGALTTGLAACGSDGDAEDNGAVHTEDTDQKDMNGATDGTADDGVLDEIGEDVKDGAEDIGEDVKDGVEDMERDNIAFIDPQFIRNGTEYGGCFTQEQMKELVAYAAERGIEVIPEIDVPGHSSAAIDAYPELSCTGETGWGEEFSYPLCAGDESTFDFFRNVMDEVAEVFGSKHFHIGGDEVETGIWADCPVCQEKLEELGYRKGEETELWTYFLERAAEHLAGKGLEVMTWDDAFRADKPLDVIYTFWRDWEPQQAASITTDNVKAATEADVIFLGVKPQMLTSVLEELATAKVDLTDKLVISMAAGFRLTSLNRLTRSERLVRIMPNTPAKLGLGITGVFFGDKVSDDDRALTLSLLEGLGTTLILKSEEEINLIGSVAGSAPAFMYRFMEALIAESVRYGMTETDARKVIEQMALGTANMVIHNQDTPLSALREAVTSKGGTTFEGLKVMTEYRFEEMMEKVIAATLKRTHEFEELF